MSPIYQSDCFYYTILWRESSSYNQKNSFISFLACFKGGYVHHTQLDKREDDGTILLQAERNQPANSFGKMELVNQSMFLLRNTMTKASRGGKSKKCKV